MSDLISRQAAINALDGEIEITGQTNAEAVKGYVRLVRDRLERLPSAQPDPNCSEIPNNSDTISRQAAIDTSLEFFVEFLGGAFEENLQKKLIERINALPSAQPERTCVNCGKTINNGGWYADGRTRCPIEEHYALPKNGYCHLWEKRNVTDDDYPERTEE